jgi:hypothetical protein
MALDLVSMHMHAIININATRSNVARRSARKDEMQEIPTSQGFLVIQICTSIVRLMRTTTPPIDNRRAKTLPLSALIFL